VNIVGGDLLGVIEFPFLALSFIRYCRENRDVWVDGVDISGACFGNVVGFRHDDAKVSMGAEIFVHGFAVGVKLPPEGVDGGW
jgi:hypothetical protein